MTDEQRPAEQLYDQLIHIGRCLRAGHRLSLTKGDGDAVMMAAGWVKGSDELVAYQPNPDAPLSEIVRQPATEREGRLVELLFYQNPIDIPKVGTIRTTAVDGDRCVWRINSLRYGSHGPFDTLADALAHAKQLAEGGE